MKAILNKFLFNEKGQATAIVLILFIFVFFMGWAVIIYAYTSSTYSARVEHHISALDAAESGLNLAIERLNTLDADLPTRLLSTSEIPFDYENRQELIEYLLAQPSEAYVEHDNFRFYLEYDDTNNENYIISMGRDQDDWRIVRVRYDAYNFTGGSPSALYVDAGNVASNYNGNAFRIDGTDHDINGNPISGTDKPGIVTSNAASSAGIRPTRAQQGNRITGSTAPPSIVTDDSNPVNISAYTENLGKIADYTFNDEDDGVLDGKLHLVPGLLESKGLPTTFGSEDTPVVIEVNTDLEILGNIEGYGIFHINGSLLSGGGTILWHGIFVVEGEEAWVHGTPDVIGALWIKSEGTLDFRVSGNPNIRYSSEAISLFGAPGFFIDRPTWEEL